MNTVTTPKKNPQGRLFDSLLVSGVTAIAILGLVALIRPYLPEKVEALGAWTALPAVFVVAWTFLTKRILEALTIGTLMGFLLVKGNGVFSAYSTALVTAMTSKDVSWLIIVCGLMGGLITIIGKSGGVLAFGQWAARRARSERSSLLWTWILGCAVFIDDYLNSMTVGSCMAPLTDRHKTPREMLAYVADSTAAPLCVLVPVTTWAAFAGRLLVKNGWCEEGATEIQMFAKTIPYNFYGWFAAILVPLVIWGVVPKLGAMKRAYERVAKGGPLAPEGSEMISILPQDRHHADSSAAPRKTRMIDFLVPMIILVVATVVADCDLQVGILVTLPVTYLLYATGGVMKAGSFWDALVEGISNLILPLLLMVMAFIFADMNEQLGFVKWSIQSASAFMTAATAPAFIFIILAITEFVTGSNWGMYVIALPIVIPLARQLGVEMPLAVAACLSAGVFGSHVSFCSDATVLSSAACGCDNFRHALSQLPYGLLAAGVSLLAYLIAGVVMAP